MTGFFFYGTLLGIIRDGSCIEGDDDIDIMINNDFLTLRKKLHYEFSFHKESHLGTTTDIIKTKVEGHKKHFASCDFYICSKENDTYFNAWQNVEVKNVELEKISWNGVVLNVPKNSEKLLEKLYSNWKKFQVQRIKLFMRLHVLEFLQVCNELNNRVLQK